MLTSTLSKAVSFVDIPEGIALALSHAIIDTVRDPLLVLDQDQRITAASRSFYQTFKLDGQDLRGQVLFDIEDGQWDIPELRELLQTIAKDQETIEGYEVDREFPKIGRRTMCLNVRKVYYEQGHHTAVLLAFEDITERRSVEQRLAELMREKDMLLDEIQHRVANSLQIIASILLIKARTVQSDETRLQLEDAHKRVLSVAAVQQHLRDTGGGRSIEIGTYLNKLCETLAESMIGDSRPITLKVEADPGTVLSHQAVSIGLVVTELVMNALKHAFPSDTNSAAIAVSYKIADTDWKLTISDNGIGKPANGAVPTKGGLGTSLVQALAKQLDAQVETKSSSHGTVVSITHATFKAKPAKPAEAEKALQATGVS